jgi:hypothetical protein
VSHNQEQHNAHTLQPQTNSSVKCLYMQHTATVFLCSSDEFITLFVSRLLSPCNEYFSLLDFISVFASLLESSPRINVHALSLCAFRSLRRPQPIPIHRYCELFCTQSGTNAIIGDGDYSGRASAKVPHMGQNVHDFRHGKCTGSFIFLAKDARHDDEKDV